MIHKNQLMEYEAGSCSFLMSYFYVFFPKKFDKMCKRKYARYVYFMKNINGDSVNKEIHLILSNDYHKL